MKTGIVNSKDLLDKSKNPNFSLSARDLLRNNKIPKTYPLEIMQSKERGKHNSFWYDGIIAKIGKYILIATGEVRIQAKGGDIVYYCGKFEDSEFEKLVVNDKALYKHVGQSYDDRYYWENNNWFEVVYGTYEKSVNRYYIEDCDMGVVEYEYDEAIKLLKWYVKEKHYERKEEVDVKKKS